MKKFWLLFETIYVRIAIGITIWYLLRIIFG